MSSQKSLTAPNTSLATAAEKSSLSASTKQSSKRHCWTAERNATRQIKAELWEQSKAPVTLFIRSHLAFQKMCHLILLVSWDTSPHYLHKKYPCHFQAWLRKEFKQRKKQFLFRVLDVLQGQVQQRNQDIGWHYSKFKALVQTPTEGSIPNFCGGGNCQPSLFHPNMKRFECQ